MRQRIRVAWLPLLFYRGILLFGGPTQAPLDARTPSATPLGVILTTAPRVAAAARAALIDEATRIWKGAGVHLEWVAPTAPRPLAFDTLHLLAVERPAAQPRTNTVVLGELLRVNTSRAVAMVSLGEAERIVASLRARRGDGSGDRRIGIILGRAAAHKIGHFLLDTSTHADHGLMRARFDETEFADSRSGAFELDEQAGDWVHQRLGQGLQLGPAARIPAATSDLVLAETHARPGFSYPR